jgi:hypothetical protein
MIKVDARPSRLSLDSLGRCYRTRLTANKRLRYASPKIALGNFFYPQSVRQHGK